MSYRALEEIRKINIESYGLENSVSVPAVPKAVRNYGKKALAFIRNWCEDLGFDNSSEERKTFADSDGKSSSAGQIPFNMERDIDRLSFERAIGRFLASGSREDAFDIYYCYCEIFKPFGSGYDSTGLLLELLSEHETNASSLLMKHRDHYSHSVYVFLTGLAIYKEVEVVRNVYNAHYGLEDKHEAACHFLKYWGLTSLFHDIGYPFEIAHQQMKTYVCMLDKDYNDDKGFAPYVSYRNMEKFVQSQAGDMNDFFAEAISARLSGKYFERAGIKMDSFCEVLKETLKDRAVNEDPSKKEYLFMDHAYFSGLMMLKSYLKQHEDISKADELPVELIDCFCAIMLHNSLFKFTIRGILDTKEPLSLFDGQPLAYILMFCDELQCWDRASYGQNSRNGVYPFDFDMTFTKGEIKFVYYFDKAYREKVELSGTYKNMCCDGYTKKSGAVRIGRSKFIDDIDEIVSIRDIIPAFEPDVNLPDPSEVISAKIIKKKKQTGLLLSDSSYLNLYNFALALNGRYCGAETVDEMTKAFEENLSLEYKLSNIAQAKGFATRLEQIGMFFTDRPVDYEPVYEFNKRDLRKLAVFEHDRWINEKLDMGWDYGDQHVGRNNGKNDNTMRERTRLHHDIIPFKKLTYEEIVKDFAPMQKMLELIKEFEGLTIYRY